MPELLQVAELSVAYGSDLSSARPVLDSLSFSVHAGEVVGMLGESGCGKTTTALAILGLLGDRTRVSGSIHFAGKELRRLTEPQMRTIRGAHITMIPQEPGLALNPVMRVGEQIVEVIQAHTPCGRRLARTAAEEMLAEVGFQQVERVYQAFPHQLSGGQQQRVTIAQALVCRPQMVIADEPTSSLDTASRKEVLALLQRLQRARGIAVLLISHQPSVLAVLADRVLVMHAGTIVEEGGTHHLMEYPTHPFLQALLACAGCRGEHAAI